jgi:hypothetical protein
MDKTIKIDSIAVCLIIYIAVCGLLLVIINKVILNNFKGKVPAFLDLVISIILNIIYIRYLITKYNIRLNLFSNITIKNSRKSFSRQA